MKISLKEFPKKIKPIRDTDVYSVHDLTFLEHLNTSMTVLHPGKETSGNSHENEEEVYIFIKGSGKMQLGKETFGVKECDVVLIKKGLFHKVFNRGSGDLVFFCVFEKYKGRGK
ncbi:MAG: cupin domain-containing protein [Candidatus Aenigmarchaeota archaeon]|nr:cupin domain-containing protein [Candidatus Aenigmarchaeota archaeon]